MRRRSDRAIFRCWMAAASAALTGGCFGDAPGEEETSSGPTSSGPTTDPPTTGPTTGTDETIGTTDAPTSSTETTADTTIDPTVADTSTSSSSDDGSSSGSESTGTGAIEPTFFDDFDRPDSQALGNGWVEKLPSVFSIDDGAVAGASNQPQQYFDQIVYQDDAVADIELRVEFRIDVANELNEPHLVARAQPDALVPGAPSHYYIFVPQLSEERLCFMRFDGDGFIGDVQCTDWPGADFVIGDWYRLVMTIEGPGPVEMTGRLEHAAGDEWEEVVAVEWIDNDASQIAEPGVWGFSGGTTGLFYNNYVFDNYSAYYR